MTPPASAPTAASSTATTTVGRHPAAADAASRSASLRARAFALGASHGPLRGPPPVRLTRVHDEPATPCHAGLSSHSKLRPELVPGRAPTDDDDADHRASRAPPPLVTLAPPPRNDMRATCAHARFRGSLSLYALKEGTGGGGHVNSSLELVAYSSPRLSRLVALGCGNADAKAIYAKPGVWLCNKCTTRSAMGHFTPRGAETCGRRATPRSPGG